MVVVKTLTPFTYPVNVVPDCVIAKCVQVFKLMPLGNANDELLIHPFGVFPAKKPNKN